MAGFVVVYDYPAPLRDLLMHRDQRASLKNPPKSVEELFDTNLQRGLATTVSVLREHAGLL